MTVGVGTRVGSGPGEVSAAQVRRRTKQGPKVGTYEDPARLLTSDGNLVAEQVQVVITSRPKIRPEGVRSKFFCALQVLPATDWAAGPAPMTTSTAYVLEWRGEGDLAPIDIWIRET
jgi:hypothetical protein